MSCTKHTGTRGPKISCTDASNIDIHKRVCIAGPGDISSMATISGTNSTYVDEDQDLTRTS